ncbi:hypothetical protein NKI77_29765 [Mesorhizobium opportunistum]|uniref:hypothetical protein n=1 Tax=Mesorhizobium opportunistum TaxID=593909 RepID=UPI003335EECB
MIRHDPPQNKYSPARVADAVFYDVEYLRLLRRRGICELGEADGTRNWHYSLADACAIGVAKVLATFGYSNEEAFRMVSGHPGVVEAIRRVVANEDGPDQYFTHVLGSDVHGSWTGSPVVADRIDMNIAWAAKSELGTGMVEAVQFINISLIAKRVALLLAGSDANE